ncbi:MAG: 4-hydroxy-tetrahydrodipicolinate reductase [Oscillospiraceae bacterium]|nr:4-hydroxy-tetrahydrodipicolinate reductase [Oscillospiraceae bacterium]
MIRLIVCGASGHVGREAVRLAEEDPAFSVAARVNRSGSDGCLSSIADVKDEADVIIDFSNHEGTAALIAYALEKKLPLVIGTTGHTPEELELITKASEALPVFKAANTSLGVAVLTSLIKQAVAAFPGAEIEIVETHHNRKLDAPSGTALALADAIASVRPDSKPVFGRSGRHKRESGEIGIHSLRMGNVVGEHEVIIDACSETLVLTHKANDRAMFADGALSAAEFIVGRPAGLYGMEQLIESMND